MYVRINMYKDSQGLSRCYYLVDWITSSEDTDRDASLLENGNIWRLLNAAVCSLWKAGVRNKGFAR